MGKKRGIFFTIDAMLAAGILVVVIIVASSVYVSKPPKAHVNFLSQDSVRVFTNLQVRELDNEYAQALIAQGKIEKENNTVLEQIGQFWSENELELARNFTRNVTNSMIPERFGMGVYVDGEEIYARNKPITRTLISSRKIITGIAKDKPTDGFTSKALLSGIKSKTTNAYSYFGGFEGEGNLTKILLLPDNVISFNSSYLEIDAGGDFTLYVNDVFSGNYLAAPANGTPKADKWNISNAYLPNFRAGENTINFNFTKGQAFVAGGFLRVRYSTSSVNDTLTPGSGKYRFPGIDGVINLYSSFYAPFNLSNMSIFLNFISPYVTYLTIGNTTVFESNGSSNVQAVYLNDSLINAMLDYTQLSEKTVPIRMGLRALSIVSGEGTKSDAVLITDRTGSMSACDVEVACTSGLCDSNPTGGCHDRRDNVAIQADKSFVDAVLNATGNNVGLVGYGKRAAPVCSFHDIGKDAASMKARLDDYSNEWCGYTCTSCGVVSATELLSENEATHQLDLKTDIDRTQYHVGDSGPVSVTETLNAEADPSKFVKGRLTVFGKGLDTDGGYRNCIFFNDNYLGRMCISNDDGSSGWHTCTFPLKPEWFLNGTSSDGNWVQTTQADFEAGTLSNIDAASSPGNALLSGQSGLSQLYYDDFDDDDISEYSTISGSWSTVAQSGLGYVLRHTSNSHTIIYNPSLSYDGSYTVKATMWNEDNDAAGIAFRVNSQDADNLYSCSATSDSAFNAGIWRHDNDLSNTPSSNLAGTSWNYVRSRWYNITISVNETSNTIRCLWVSQEAGVELDVTATDDDVRESGSVGFWLSSNDNFMGDLLSVWETLGGNAGTLVSSVFDSGVSANWDTLKWTETTQAASNITLQLRSGNTQIPDSSWDNFNWAGTNYTNPNGTLISEKPAQYAQWLATFLSSDSGQFVPILSDVSINYTTYFGSNNVTITGANTNSCFGTSGEQDDWDFKDVKLNVWESPTAVNVLHDSDATQYTLDDGQEAINVTLNLNVDKSKLRAAQLEFEAIDVDPSYYDCAYVNGDYVGRIDYQKWSGTNEWQRALFDVPAIYVDDGQNSVVLRSGTTSGCERTSGDNDLWRFRNVNLSVRWTDEEVGYDRFKSMLIMSDGEANTKIGDCKNCDAAGASAETIQKACEANDAYGIRIYAVAFGSVSQTAIDTLNQTACCDDCSNFYTSNNAQELIDIYTQIATSVVNISFDAQSLNLTGQTFDPTELFSDSYIAYNYTSLEDFKFAKIPLAFETERFGNNVSQGSFTVPANVTVADARVTSYSGNAWTDSLSINSNEVYSLSKFGDDYSILGDPFIVEVPPENVVAGSNALMVSSGVDPQNSTGGSEDNRALYTLLLSASSDFSAVLSKFDGCTWSLQFDDGSSDTLKVPVNYTGSDTCNFQNATYDANDAVESSVFQLLKNLDLDKDGKLDIKIGEEDFDIDSLTITKVPSLWGPSIVEIRVWE
jgi:hypothetical protein